MTMNPLLNTRQVGQVEEEMAQLFAELYGNAMADLAEEINVYGAPHLGTLGLMQRALTADGLSVLNPADVESIRYLFRAWRHRNPKRGTHFLRTYLRVLFGRNFEINQLWQKTDQPYPTALLSQDEAERAGISESARFLTSRLRIDLDTEALPASVLASLKTVVPARMVLLVRILRRAGATLGVANVAQVQSLMIAKGDALLPRQRPLNEVGVVGVAGAVSVFSAKGAS